LLYGRSSSTVFYITLMKLDEISILFPTVPTSLITIINPLRKISSTYILMRWAMNDEQWDICNNKLL